MSDNEDEEFDQDNQEGENDPEDENEEISESATMLEKIEERFEPEADDDPSVHKDLAYYVDKIAKNLENKEGQPAEGSKFSDSESDAEMPDQPDDGDNLRPAQMKSLQNTMKKSSPFHESNLGLFRTVCFAPYKRFVDISSIREFRNLRCVDFGKNYIRDVSALNQLPFLGTIKLYKNGLRVLDSLRSRSVRYLDLSHNKLKDLDKTHTPRLTRLKLVFNRIGSLEIFQNHEIKWLRKLELRGNGLKSTAGIQHPLLEELYLAENDIREIEDLEKCPNLRILHLRDNQILEVTGFSRKNVKLEYVNLRNNLITFLDEAVGVSVLPKLEKLIMLDNPVQLEQEYRIVMVARIPSLKILDKQEIEPYDRDWCIMLLLDSLYHEETDLKIAVSDLFDNITPAEIPDMDDLMVIEQKRVTVVEPDDDTEMLPYDPKNAIDQMEYQWSEKGDGHESDDDLKRKYGGEGEKENEDNEEE